MSADADKLDNDEFDVVKQGVLPDADNENDDDLQDADESGHVEDDGEHDEGSVDIVKNPIEGKQPQKKEVTQEQLDAMIGRRVKKEKNKTDQVNSELEAARETIRLQQAALDSRNKKPEPLKRPVAADYDGGADDEAFLSALDAYTDAKIASQVQTHLGKNNETLTQTAQQEAAAKALAAKQKQHYERAIKLGAKDFAATEDRAIEVLGESNVDQIIANFDDSHILLYYLGKDANKAEAQKLASLINSNPVQGVAALGALRHELKVVTNGKPAPNPDDELRGATVGGKPSERGPKGATFT